MLLAIGELGEAERVVAQVLEEEPSDETALSLCATVKHRSGELTLAIAIWAELALSRGGASTGRSQIQALLGLARAPERNAGEFMAAGRFHLVRKPALYLELEPAFKLYVARRPLEARRYVEAVADKVRARDRSVYRLAMLSHAWISEHIGELEQAAATLELLGRERDFAADVERVLMLANVYQQIGTSERLTAAIHIYRYLEGTLGLDRALLGQVARCHERVGHGEDAARFERRHLAHFREVMDRPSAVDVVAVASVRYLPLARLLPAFRDDEPGSAALLLLGEEHERLGTRERGIALGLAGEHERAEEVLARSQHALDFAYRGDVARLSGDGARARGFYEASLRELGATELDGVAWIAGNLLDGALSVESAPDSQEAGARLVESGHEASGAGQHDAASLHAVASMPAWRSRVTAALEQRVEVCPEEPRAWRRLGLAHALSGNEEAVAECDARAVVLEQAQHQDRQSIGHARAAAVYQFGGMAHGLVHELWAQREPIGTGSGGHLPLENLHGNLSDEMRRDVRNVFYAVREFALVRLRHLALGIDDYHYRFKVTKEDEESGGRSAGLPTALAFLSVFIQRPLLPRTVATGAIVPDSHRAMMVTPVGDVDHKVAASYHWQAERVLLPAGNRATLAASAALPRAVADGLVVYVATLDDAVRAAFGGDLFA